MADFIEKELGWDDEISKESDFILLPEGIYDFEVVAVERARHNGSAKLPPCPKAIVSLRINSPEGNTTIKHNLFLHTKCEGMLSSFFIAIGQKKHGQPLRMNWQAAIGSRGKAKVIIEEWTGNNGEQMKSNRIGRFIDTEKAKEQSNNSNNQTTWSAGKF